DRHLAPPRPPVRPLGVAAPRRVSGQGHRAVLPPGGRARPAPGQPGGVRQGRLRLLPRPAAVPRPRPRRPRAVRRLGRLVRARARGHHRRPGHPHRPCRSLL
ncbi:MAG: Transcription_WhiD, partial [uncultured Actinomycetospora sp.]